MTTTAPKTAAQATSMIATLQAKRAGLVQTIDTGGERRKGLATKAEFGDDSAKAALSKIETEEATARGALQNLEIVINEMERTRDTLQAQEAVALEGQNSAELSAAIDGLLALDDEIDDALEHARTLLTRRDEFKAANSATLRRIPGKMVGAMLGRDSEIGDSLLAYFDRQLAWMRGDKNYAAITRVADWDSRYYRKQSPRMIERGPRELSPFERTMQRELGPRSAPIEVPNLKQARR
jgi:hypothetical protein